VPVEQPRRFPPPWDIEEHNRSCFIVRDYNAQALAYVYFETEPGRRTAVTAASLGALKLDTDVTDKFFFDTDVPGFGLRVRASGARTWIFQYKVGGEGPGGSSWATPRR